MIVLVGLLIIAVGSYIVYYGQKIENEKSTDPKIIRKEAMMVENKPKIIVTTIIKDTTVNLTIEVRNVPLISLTIYYPIQGIIKSIKDENTLLSANTAVMRAVGEENGISTNNAEILINNVSLNTKINYKISFKPLLPGVYTAGRDRYTLNYSWLYKGSTFHETERFLIDSDHNTGKPDAEVIEFQYFNRALTPEEVKKVSDEMGKKRKFD